jgi:hypothetical protein
VRVGDNINSNGFLAEGERLQSELAARALHLADDAERCRLHWSCDPKARTMTTAPSAALLLQHKALEALRNGSVDERMTHFDSALEQYEHAKCLFEVLLNEAKSRQLTDDVVELSGSLLKLKDRIDKCCQRRCPPLTRFMQNFTPPETNLLLVRPPSSAHGLFRRSLCMHHSVEILFSFQVVAEQPRARYLLSAQ